MSATTKRAHRRHSLAALLAAAALCACGGGGDDTPVTVQVPQGLRSVAASAGADLDEANYAALSAPLVRALLAAAAGDLLEVTQAREQPQAATGAAWAGSAGTPVRLLRDALHRSARALAREQPLAAETLACAGGGTMTVDVADVDADEKLSRGDTLAVSLAGCVAEAGLPPADGGLAVAVNVVELDGNQSPTAVDLSVRIDQLAIAGLGTMDGGLRLWSKPDAAGGERLRISFQALNVAEAGQTVVYDFDLHGLAGAAGMRFDLSGGIGVGGQTYAVVPVAAFSQADGQPPASGAADLRDAAGDAARLTARSAADFDLQLLRGGAALAELLGQRWADYRLGG